MPSMVDNIVSYWNVWRVIYCRGRTGRKLRKHQAPQYCSKRAKETGASWDVIDKHPFS